MRKLIALALCCALLALPLSSCSLFVSSIMYGDDYCRELRGLDDYLYTSGYSTGDALAPEILVGGSDIYAPLFPYVGGDYFLYETNTYHKIKEDYETRSRALLYLQYGEDTYAQAKQFVMQRALVLSEEPLFTYGGAVFYENNSPRHFREGYEPAIDNDNAPYEFSYFAYDDSRRILLFLAFYSENLNEEVEAEAGCREERISLYFGEWYSFA